MATQCVCGKAYKTVTRYEKHLRGCKKYIEYIARYSSNKLACDSLRNITPQKNNKLILVDDIILLILSYLLPDEIRGFMLGCKETYKLSVDAINLMTNSDYKKLLEAMRNFSGIFTEDINRFIIFRRMIFTDNYFKTMEYSANSDYLHIIKVLHSRNLFTAGEIIECTTELPQYATKIGENVFNYAFKFLNKPEEYKNGCLEVPLRVALGLNYVNVAKQIINSGYASDHIEFQFMTACSSGSIDVVEFLLSRNGGKIPYNDLFKEYSLLKETLTRGHLDIVKLLVKDPKMYDCMCRFLGSELDVTEILIELFRRPTCKGSLEIVRYLFEDLKDIPCGIDLVEVLRLAFFKDSTQVIIWLLSEKKIRPLQTSYWNKTFVDVCSDDMWNSVSILLKCTDFDPTFKDNKPLRSAIRSHANNVVDILLKNKQVINSLTCKKN